MPRVASRQGRLRTADVATNERVLFSDLMLSEPVLRGLLESGFERPSPIQLQAIPVGLLGTDLIAQAKSGTGKTCVFAVVALENVQPERAVPQAIVLAPTREIAVQIGHVFAAIGSHCDKLALEVIIGGMAIQRDRERLRSCNVVVGTPGRVCGLLAEGSLPGEAVRMLVLDEADKLMDHIFMQDLEYIVDVLPKRKQILALSATYTTEQRELLTRWMREPTTVLLDADNVSLRGVAQRYRTVTPIGQATGQYALFEGKATVLLQLLGMTAFHQCLVFMNGRARAHDLVATLNHHGYPSAFISGDLPQQQRNAVMASMRSLRLRVLISTDLTARGVDMERVNLVVNLDLPRCAETYIHRVGRTGRFGTNGTAIALVSSDELPVLLDMVKSLNSTIEPIDSEVDEVAADTAVADTTSVDSSDNDVDRQQQRGGPTTSAAVSANRSLELDADSSGLDADIDPEAFASANSDPTGIADCMATDSPEDQAEAAQLARLMQLREQAAANQSHTLELRRHPKAASHGSVQNVRAKHRRSKSRCGLRVSFNDGSAITEADAADLPALFRTFGEIQSTQFRIGKTHGWVDYVDTSPSMAARVRDAVNGNLQPLVTQLGIDSGSSNIDRKLIVQLWSDGSAVPVQEGPVSAELAQATHTESTGTIAEQSQPHKLSMGRSSPGVNVLPSPGATVWAKYTADGLWYKAEVSELIRVGGEESESPDDEVDGDEIDDEFNASSLRVAVTYLGYNNFEVLPLSSIWLGCPDPSERAPRSRREACETMQAQWVNTQDSALSRAEAMANGGAVFSRPAVAEDETTADALGDLCYGHPWYISYLMMAGDAHYVNQTRRSAAPVPIAPFPFPRSAIDAGRQSDPTQWHWRWLWPPSTPPLHWRANGM